MSSVCGLASLVSTTENHQLADVTIGLIYLHDNGMVHGDLKGVSFRSLEYSAALKNVTCQGEHTGG